MSGYSNSSYSIGYGEGEPPPRGIECAGCSLMPSDLPDEETWDDGWMRFFGRENGAWYCLGCDPYA